MMWPSPGPGHASYGGGGGGGGGGGLNDGDSVLAWPDSSGYYNSALKVGNPIFKTSILNGKPVVRLRSASSDGFNLTSTISPRGPWTQLIVAKAASTAAQLFSLYSNGVGTFPFGLLLNSDHKVYFSSGSFFFNSPVEDLTAAFHIYAATVVAGDDTGTFSIDGAGITGAATVQAVTDSLGRIGYRDASVSPSYSDGDIAEILHVNLDLSPGSGNNTIQNLIAYLGAKYGIAVTGGGTPVDPGTYGFNLVGWWQADSLLLKPPTGLNDGDTVNLWPDLSGQAHDGLKVGTPVFKKSIVGGRPVVRLTSASQSGFNIANPISGTGPWETFVVMKPASPTTGDLYSLACSADGTPLGVLELMTGADFLMFGNKANVFYATPNPYRGAFHIFNAACDAAISNGMNVDASIVGMTTGAAAAVGDFNNIGYRQHGPDYSDGDLAEIIQFNRVLGAGPDRAGIRQYLSDFYGLGLSLATPVDPSTVAGLVGWWKAASLLSPQFTIKDATVSGDNARIMVPANRVAGTALIWCHGLGGSEKDITNTPNTNYTYAAMAAGHLVAACYGFGYNWDNPTAQAALEALVAYLAANYGVTRAVLIGGSAGGPLGLLKATQGFTGVSIPGWHGIFPIVDLDAAHKNASLVTSINTAFPGYPGSAAGRDPALFAASLYNGKRLRCCQSDSDTVAPRLNHGSVLVTLATGHATEVTCVPTTGDHGDPSNFTPALVNDFMAFIGRCLP